MRRGRVVLSVSVTVRRPLFGRHGRKVIAAVCAYEVAALPARSPLPTVSTLVARYPACGWLLLAALAHHWFLEGSVIPTHHPPHQRETP